MLVEMNNNNYNKRNRIYLTLYVSSSQNFQNITADVFKFDGVTWRKVTKKPLIMVCLYLRE